MNLDDFTAASLQRMHIGKVERIWIPPRPTLEVMLAYVEVRHVADNLWCLEHGIGTRDPEAAKFWRKQLRFVRKAHALGFISDERYARITVPWTPGQPDNGPHGDEWQALMRLEKRYFPSFMGRSTSGKEVFYVLTADDDKHFLWLTRSPDGTWIIEDDEVFKR